MENSAAQRPGCRLFGRLEVWGRQGTRVEFLSERSKHLFAVLALQKGAPVSRDVLVARLWTDGSDERLRRNLSTEVWRLRCALVNAGENASRWINARPEALSLVQTNRFGSTSKRLTRPSRRLHCNRSNRIRLRHWRPSSISIVATFSLNSNTTGAWRSERPIAAALSPAWRTC